MPALVKWTIIGVLILIGLFFLIGAYYLIKLEVRRWEVRKATQTSYASKVDPLMDQALKNLQTTPDDWLLCTELGLLRRDQDISEPSKMAAWVAYYQYGSQYCKKWWDWNSTIPCDELSQLQPNSNNQVLWEKKLALCKIAEKRARNAS